VDVTMTVNCEPRHVAVEARDTLADALREGLRLTGTNLGCEHGVCGSCTVSVDGVAVRSCLLLAAQCDGCEVRTVEGLTGPDGELSVLQQAFSAEHGLQCGFCTPGFLCLLQQALDDEPELDRDEQRLTELLASNLCRCTGYTGIRRAVVRAARQLRGDPVE
jgi:aerobic carbon-monoxide dehydrogenase small subunit